MEFCSGLSNQRIAGKKLQRLLHISKMPGAVLRHIAFSVGAVMTDSAKMPEQFARGDRPFLLRKRRTVCLHRSIQDEFAALPNLQNRSGRNRFGDGAQAEKR